MLGAMCGSLITQRPGLRERKRRRTESDLRSTALALFGERGFDQVTVDEIADVAGVSKTTFYRYFESKEDVLLGRSGEKLELMRAALAAQPVDEPVFTAVRNAFFVVADRFEIEREERLAVRRLLQATPSLAARNLAHQAAWELVLREFVAQRLADGVDGLRPRVLAAMVNATLRAAIDAWSDAGGTTDLRSVIGDALSFVVAGVPQ
jgi:AcrR family transcriptional regulator